MMLFIVDNENAYDLVDWGYLNAVIGRMYFPSSWIKLIKKCICTAYASVLVNGSPIVEFPFLFIGRGRLECDDESYS